MEHALSLILEYSTPSEQSRGPRSDIHSGEPLRYRTMEDIYGETAELNVAHEDGEPRQVKESRGKLGSQVC
jgi:hypothetical protein